ncbi:MAG TPA: hypothetical protein VM900_09610, partial [Sphingomonas sp.]|nr:hypothetical protein [Sphingomonas sp.]
LSVPDANKSPYPLQEPPHAHSAPVQAVKKADKTNKTAKSSGRSKATGLNGKVALGTAFGLGALALVAALLDRRSKAAKPKSGKARKR